MSGVREMAVFRQIHVSFWQDEFVLDLEPEEKYFYLYLMTNSKTTQCGIYKLPKKLMAVELGYSIDTVSKLLIRFIDMGKILFSEESGEVLLLNWLKHNSMKSPKVKACVEKELKAVKNKGFVDCFGHQCIQYGYSIDTLSIQWGEELRTKNKELITNKDIPPIYPPAPSEPPELPKKKAKKKKAEREPLVNYAEYVSMTEKEYNELVKKFEVSGTVDFIERLNLYKGSTGKKYENDYLTILNWYRKDEEKKKEGKAGGKNSNAERLAEEYNLGF